MTPTYGPISCVDFLHTPDGEEAELSVQGRAAVRRFREALARMLAAEARGGGAAEGDLSILNSVLSRAARCRGLVPTVRGYGWGWVGDPGRTIRILFAPAWSAAQLLGSEDRHRLKSCDGCGRLFLDRSRNRSRRWCDMDGCGNRSKVRRHRNRNAALQTGKPPTDRTMVALSE